MKTDEAIALLKAEMLMLAPNGNPISDLYYAVEMAIEALGDRFELNEYRQCGTVEECRSRMEWMSYSMDDVRRKFLFIREEALAIAKEKVDDRPSKPKRGGPRKAEGGCEDGV
jgi:hypothetical protein